MMSKKIPILLLATERSGTNLLRAIMSSHSRIASPAPFSMVDVLADTHYKYLGDAEHDHFDELIRDAIKLTQAHLNPWHQQYSIDDVKRRLMAKSYWDIFRVLNELYAESDHKQHWFSKEPGLFRHIYELTLHLPDAKFVYLARDPRDVVASMVEGGIHAQNVYMAACKWRDEQRLCLTASKDALLKDRFFSITYERLLRERDRIIRILMADLGIDYEPEQLEYYKNDKILMHSKKSEFWKNLSKPIDESKRGGYTTKLTKYQIRVIESVCFDEMKALGYLPDYPTPIKINMQQKIWYNLHSLAKSYVKRFSLSEEAGKHKERIRVAQEIRSRGFS